MSINGECVDCGAPLGETEVCTICESWKRIIALSQRNRREYHEMKKRLAPQPQVAREVRPVTNDD